MENAVEALKMAGSVLLFVMALSIAMLSFTQARTAIGTLVDYSDREYSTIEDDDRFYYRKSTDTERYVGIDTIIPTIYRAFSESYKIVFETKRGENDIAKPGFPNTTYYLYKIKPEDRPVYKIDSIEENGISDKQDFLNGILYHKFDHSVGNFGEKNSEGIIIGKTNRRELHTTGLYEYLKDVVKEWKIKETLGTYYMEDRTDADGKRLNMRKDEEGNPAEISDVNKRELRVITYTFERR